APPLSSNRCCLRRSNPAAADQGLRSHARFDHQTQVGPNHQCTRLAIPLFDLSGKLDLLLPSPQRNLPAFPPVNPNSPIPIFSSHITLFHHSFEGIGSTTSRTLYSSMPSQSRVVAS